MAASAYEIIVAEVVERIVRDGKFSAREHLSALQTKLKLSGFSEDIYEHIGLGRCFERKILTKFLQDAGFAGCGRNELQKRFSALESKIARVDKSIFGVVSLRSRASFSTVSALVNHIKCGTNLTKKNLEKLIGTYRTRNGLNEDEEIEIEKAFKERADTLRNERAYRMRRHATSRASWDSNRENQALEKIRRSRVTSVHGLYKLGDGISSHFVQNPVFKKMVLTVLCELKTANSHELYDKKSNKFRRVNYNIANFSRENYPVNASSQPAFYMWAKSSDPIGFYISQVISEIFRKNQLESEEYLHPILPVSCERYAFWRRVLIDEMQLSFVDLCHEYPRLRDQLQYFLCLHLIYPEAAKTPWNELPARDPEAGLGGVG